MASVKHISSGSAVEAPAPAAPPVVARPCFTGTWLNTSYDSPDVEAFFRDGMQYGWMLRAAAKAANYGCGQLVHNIVQEDETALNIRITGVQGVPDQWFTQRLDGKPQKTEDGASTYVYAW